jgi:hypothetical protein
LTAVLVFEKEVISWPSAEEKKTIPKILCHIWAA